MLCPAKSHVNIISITPHCSDFSPSLLDDFKSHILKGLLILPEACQYSPCGILTTNFSWVKVDIQLGKGLMFKTTTSKSGKRSHYKDKLLGAVLHNKVCETTIWNTDQARTKSRVNDPFRMDVHLMMNEQSWVILNSVHKPIRKNSSCL